MSSAHGAVAYFKTPGEILSAAKTATEKGFKNVEAYTPFPIHGMDEALNLKPSIVPWATLIGGITGFAIATHLQIWTSAMDWPINVGGKPMVSLPAFIPVMFELTVLLAGLSTAAFMFFLNGLPNFKPNPFDPRITDDRFALYIPFAGQSSAGDVENFLQSLNAEKVSQVSEQV
ncbi:MAG: DUF3341 domain-containing protein [Oligoflexia bacterium]|nr:DUF3341 domain-containing protein [Oligoflexia bacterium]